MGAGETRDHYDVLIVGGGMVGASLAVALAPLPLSIAVIEAWPHRSDSQPSYDDRSTAVAAGSRRIFEAMGCWDAIAADATAIDHIHVSDRGRFGFTRLDSDEYGVEALGYVVENRRLGEVLWRSLSEAGNIDLIVPGTVVAVDHGEHGERDASVEVEQEGQPGRKISASLVVAADGVRSRVRELVELTSSTWEYGQTAVIANVSTTIHHDGAAFERFTASGPLALLPMTEGRCSLVWTLAPDAADRILALGDDEFLDQLQTSFGYRLGRFSQVGKRAAYPLGLTRAHAQGTGRVLLIGNASHGIHPVGGQGFNLGLRDVATLAEVLASAVGDGTDPADPDVIDRYVEWRRPDHQGIMALTDSLVRVFTNPLGPVKAARALGLIGLDLVPPIKDQFARRTMGMHGRLPKMARGMPLS